MQKCLPTLSETLECVESLWEIFWGAEPEFCNFQYLSTFVAFEVWCILHARIMLQLRVHATSTFLARQQAMISNQFES